MAAAIVPSSSGSRIDLASTKAQVALEVGVRLNIGSTLAVGTSS